MLKKIAKNPTKTTSEKCLLESRTYFLSTMVQNSYSNRIRKVVIRKLNNYSGSCALNVGGRLNTIHYWKA